MDQDQVGMLGVNLVEALPDQVVVVEVKATGECDLRSGRHHDFGLGATFGCDKVSGVDHCRGKRAVVDKRPRPGAPGRTGMDLKTVASLIAKEFEAIAAFD